MSSETAISGPIVALPGARPRSATRSAKAVGVWLIFAALAVATLYPLFFLASTSLRPEEDYLRNPAGMPAHLTLDQFGTAWDQAHIAQYALNSLLVVVPAVTLLTVLATLAAYGLSCFDFRLKGLLFVLVVVLLAIPPTILLIPIFKLIKDAGLLNNRMGLTLVYTALSLPFSIFLLSSFMRLVPRELLHAARVDGAGALRTLWSVVVPLVGPALLTLVTLNFLFLWNEFIFSLVLLQDESQRTIMVGIAGSQTRLSHNVGVVSAGLLLSMIPPLLIFVFFQRSLTRGLTAGAVK
jgi:ABC-type glycerol-3-phosphate transport system permease component